MEQELTAIQGMINAAINFVVEYGFQILGAIIILLIGFQIARWVSNLILRLCERKNLDITLSKFMAGAARILVLAFVVIIAMGKFGITIAPFVAAIGALAFGSSLALQGPLSNYGAGFVIIFGCSFVVGNTITVQEVTGIVEEVKLAATILRTEDGEQITIPNKQIVGEILLNSFDHKIVETTIGISYDDDPDQAVRLIADTLGSVAGIAAKPVPQIGIDNFGDSSIDIGLRYWVPTDRYFETKFAANQSIYRAIKAAGITIPYPHRQVRIDDFRPRAG